MPHLKIFGFWSFESYETFSGKIFTVNRDFGWHKFFEIESRISVSLEAFEHARSSVAELIGAKSPQEFLGNKLKKLQQKAERCKYHQIFVTRCYSTLI